MNTREYIYMNRAIVIVGVITFCVLLYCSMNGSYGCVHLDYTGQECKSCGVTRDFISFLKFNFHNPINSNSLVLFFYLLLQLLYRSIISVFGMGPAENSSMISIDQPLGREGIKNGIINAIDIKKVITTDVIITFLLGLFVFLPFWI